MRKCNKIYEEILVPKYIESNKTGYTDIINVYNGDGLIPPSILNIIHHMITKIPGIKKAMKLALYTNDRMDNIIKFMSTYYKEFQIVNSDTIHFNDTTIDIITISTLSEIPNDKLVYDGIFVDVDRDTTDIDEFFSNISSELMSISVICNDIYVHDLHKLRIYGQQYTRLTVGRKIRKCDKIYTDNTDCSDDKC